MFERETDLLCFEDWLTKQRRQAALSNQELKWQSEFGEATYVGEVKDGAACGEGIVTYANPSGNLGVKEYKGTFLGGVYHGKGTLTLIDGSFV